LTAEPTPPPIVVSPASRLRRGPSRGRPSLGEDEKAIRPDELLSLLAVLGAKAGREKARGNRRGPRRRDLLLVRLLAGTGLRASEAARLLVGDLRLEGKGPYLRIRGGKKRPTSHVDTVPVPIRLADELERWIFARCADEPLFHLAKSERALDRRGVWKIVKRAAREAGVRKEVSVHSLRHFYLTEVFRRTRGDLVLAARLGRLRSTETLATYVHHSSGERRRVVDSIELP